MSIKNLHKTVCETENIIRKMPMSFKYCDFFNLPLRISDIKGNEKKVPQNCFDLNIIHIGLTKNLQAISVHTHRPSKDISLVRVSFESGSQFGLFNFCF